MRRCRPTAAQPSWARTGTTCKRNFRTAAAAADTLEGGGRITPELFGDGAFSFQEIDSVLILACGTLTAAAPPSTGWRALPKSPQVEIASEYALPRIGAQPKTLVVTITQSGETADTLAALRHGGWA